MLYFIARIGVGEVMSQADSPVNGGQLVAGGGARSSHINTSNGVGGALYGAES